MEDRGMRNVFQRVLMPLALVCLLVSGVSPLAAEPMYGLTKWWFRVVDANGVPITSGLSIQVNIASTSNAATLYTTDQGAATKTNPYNIESTGQWNFYYGAATADILITESPTSVTVLKVAGATNQYHNFIFYPAKFSSIGSVSATAATITTATITTANTTTENVGTLTVGTGGSALTLMKLYDYTMSDSVLTDTAATESAITISGIASTDVVFVNAPSTLTHDVVIVGARVSGTNTVVLKFFNGTAGASTTGTGTVRVFAIRKP
jgi:hypothetical protein